MKTLALVTSSFVIAYLALELVFSFVTIPEKPKSSKQIYKTAKICYDYSLKKECTTSRMIGGSYTEYNGQQYSHNSHGWRDVEHDYDNKIKPRTLIIGDSFVWGQGVAFTDTFHQRVQATRQGRELLAMGQCGYSMKDYWNTYYNYARHFGADEIVLSIVANDLEIKPYKRKPLEKLFNTRSPFLTFAEHRIRREYERKELRKHQEASTHGWHVKLFKEALRNFKEVGKPLYILRWFNGGDFRESLIKKILDEGGYSYIDVDYTDLHVSDTDSHPNAEAHAKAAALLLKSLDKRNSLR